MCLLQFFREIAENLFGFESACWPVAIFREIAENLFGFEQYFGMCWNFFREIAKKNPCVFESACWSVAIVL